MYVIKQYNIGIKFIGPLKFAGKAGGGV